MTDLVMRTILGIGARIMMANRHGVNIKERQEISDYFNTYQMYCEGKVVERLKQLKKKLVLV